ncbi:MAG: hypothetical protein HY738_00345 [Bacteroidia bacterium]|nr:hypothetical protein [Bacteroidia bacterium]
METIVIKIECNPKYSFCNELREQGLLFDTIREAINVDDEGLQEVTWEEYELLEKFNTQLNDKN